MATIYIIDTHNIIILVNLGICFKHFGGDKTNEKCRQVSLWDGNINEYGIMSQLQPQYSWSNGKLFFLHEDKIFFWSMRQSTGKKESVLTIF